MKKSVLVVDDDPMIHKTVEKILEIAGIEVVAASSGQECLEIMEQGFEGLVLMDIIMPGMNGWDTIQALYDRGFVKGNIICMLTGQESVDNRMDAFKEHVLDYLRKPVNYERLVKVVKQYLSYLE